MKKKKVLFLINNPSFFVSHRLNLFLEARKNGYEAKVILGSSSDTEINKIAMKIIFEKNIDYKLINFKSSNINPINEIFNLINIFIIFLSFKPHIVHAVSLKPILLSGLCSIFFKKVHLIMVLSGLGYLYTDTKKIKRTIVKKIFEFFLNYILFKNKIHVIVQNKDDLKFILKKFNKVKSNKIKLISGCGIDTNKFDNKQSKKEKIILFPSRLLKNKGTIEFLEAANFLKHRFQDWKFILVGSLSIDNPDSVNVKILNKYIDGKNIKWLGYKNNILNYYQKASIVCLPSYREGMPQSLLEGSSCKCAIVTTNTIGCREAIIKNKTGILIKEKDVKSLIVGLQKLMQDRSKVIKFGENGRQYVIKKFKLSVVNKQFLDLYKKILNIK